MRCVYLLCLSVSFPIFSKENEWQEIHRAWTNLTEIDFGAKSLAKLSNTADPDSDSYEFEKTPLGLRNDVIRTEMNLEKAKNHLLFGNYLLARKIATKELSRMDSRNLVSISNGEKILYESDRKLKNYVESTQICLKMLSIAGNNESLFSKKWIASCSFSFLKASQENENNKQFFALKEGFLTWSQAPIIKNQSSNNMLSTIFISLTFRNLKLKNESFSYLTNAILSSKDNSNNLDRAYLVLSLLKFELGMKDDSLALLRYLSGSFNGYGKNLIQFKISNQVRQISRLCLARFHASQGNLNAAETWYKDVLLEKNITGTELKGEEQSKAHYEYSHILYMQKKYFESAVEYKKIYQTSEIENKLNNLSYIDIYNEKSNEFKKSNFTLAKIISKIKDKNHLAETQLINLYGSAKADLIFINEKLREKGLVKEEMIQNISDFAMIAEEYGIRNKETLFAIQIKEDLQNLSLSINQLKKDFANAVNVLDYTYTGINETRAIASLYDVFHLRNKIIQVILMLDKIEYNKWSNESFPGIEYAKKNRLVLLDNFINFIYKDDDQKNIFVKTIKQPKMPGKIQDLSQAINALSANIAAVKFLFTASDYSIPSMAPNNLISYLENSYSDYIVQTLENNLSSIVLKERLSYISENLGTNESKDVFNNFKSFEQIFYSLYELHKSNNSVNIITNGDNELRESLDISWNNTIETYKTILNSVVSIKERIETERREVISNYKEILNYIKSQEKNLNDLKTAIVKDYSFILPKLSENISPKIIEFSNFVELSMADYNKDYAEKLAEDNEFISKAMIQRKKWLRSMHQQLERDFVE